MMIYRPSRQIFNMMQAFRLQRDRTFRVNGFNFCYCIWCVTNSNLYYVGPYYGTYIRQLSAVKVPRVWPSVPVDRNVVLWYTVETWQRSDVWKIFRYVESHHDSFCLL